MLKVNLVSYGIATRVGNEIYLNKDLLDYPVLKNAILSHERKHTDSFSLKDLYLDVTGAELDQVKKDYWKFVFTHPSSLVQFLPIWKFGKTWCFDIALILVYLLLGGLIWLAMRIL
jgi:hypothetical protein